MEKYYSTSEVAEMIGIHPNTVRLYEELDLITPPKRKENGYRIFLPLHIEQFRVARLAFEVEVLQNGLRKTAVQIVKTLAAQEFDQAVDLTYNYLRQIEVEKRHAEEAINITEHIIAGETDIDQGLKMTRKQTAAYLGITIDTLRNWELNGLLTVKRKKNGYRIYTESDIRRLKIIRSLRCANYSLAAILRMLGVLSNNPDANIRDAIDTPRDNDEIITACDHLLTSLSRAETNAREIQQRISNLKK